jgi:YgiT-type zinc finger domain-containing protein
MREISMSLPERAPSFSRQAYGIQRPQLRSVPSLDPDETLPLGVRRASESQPMLPMRCLGCHGPVQKSTAPVSITGDGYQLSWEAVPAWVCARCGSSYFEPREVQRIRHAVQAVSSARRR